MKKKMLRLAVPAALTAGMAAAWLNASQSTRRYVIHLGKQVPFLPYRYFI